MFIFPIHSSTAKQLSKIMPNHAHTEHHHSDLRSCHLGHRGNSRRFWGTDQPPEVQALGDFLDLVHPFQQLLHHLKTYLVQTVVTTVLSATATKAKWPSISPFPTCLCICLYTCGGFPKRGYPQIIYFNGSVPYKPSILGNPIFRKPP